MDVLLSVYVYGRFAMNMISPPGTTMVMNGVTMSSGSTPQNMKTSGLGDVTLTVLYALLSGSRHHVLLSGGLSVPTGSIQVKGDASSMYPDFRYPYMMQQGSGTWDVQPGATYTYSSKKFMASTQFLSVIHTGYNAVGYKLGNAYTYNNWIAYKWFDWLSTSLRLEANTTGAIKGGDASLYAFDEPSANPSNYGGTAVWSHLGCNVYVGNYSRIKHRIGMEAGIPLYKQMNGVQVPMLFSAHGMYSVMF
jgi:hypothetical protein